MTRFILSAVLLAGTAAQVRAADPPRKIAFQGKLLDSGNVPRNGVVDLDLRIYDAPSAGNQLWPPAGSEQHDGIPVSNGVFSLQIGSLSALTADIFSGTSAFLEIDVDPAGAEPLETLAPRMQLVGSAYAMTASQLVQAGSIRVNAGLSYSTFTTGGDLQLENGVSAATGAFSIGIIAATASFTGTGIAQYSVTSSSGINVLAGTLKLDAASRGLDATGTGVVASTFTGGNFSGIGVSSTVVKIATEASVNSTLQNDDELSLGIGANETWVYQGYLDVANVNATPDFKMAFTIPAGATMSIGWQANNATLASQLSGTLLSSGVSTPLIPLGVNIYNPVFFEGAVSNGGTAGRFQLQWSEFATDATNTTRVRGNSFLKGTRVR